MVLDPSSCYRALLAHDPRFDGVFFVGVTSTRIYCRPVCRARTPRADRCRFFGNAATAERAGFRPCLRCRPELAPGRASIDAVGRLASAAAHRIAAGALNDGCVDRLAGELGVSGRHLRRVLESELGVSPVELAQTHRLLLAKRLLTDTALPIAQVAFGSGFQSLRRFNALFRTRYRLSPSALRHSPAPGPARSVSLRPLAPARHSAAALAGAPVPGNGPGTLAGQDMLRLTLAYRPPMAWDALLAFLGARATRGVEHVDGRRYARTVRIGEHDGLVAVEPSGGARREEASLSVEVSASLVLVLMPLLARLRHLFDLDAEPGEIEGHLERAGLKDLVRRQPGLRVPGSLDGFELALRAVLGQQVSVRAATTLAGRFAHTFGEPIETGHPALSWLPASAERIAEASLGALTALGIPEARAISVQALARAAAGGALRLEPGVDVDHTIQCLTALPGIGDWTAQYIAMRALRWPDAFPAGDLGLRRASGESSTQRLRHAAERWRPWRAYAALHLWTSLTPRRILGDAEGDQRDAQP